MAEAKWTVDVGGVEHLVALQTDAQTGRTAIRVDGRIAGRPLSGTDQERVILVGYAKYFVRRAANDMARSRDSMARTSA